MAEERQGPSRGVHLKMVSVFIESHRKWMKNGRSHFRKVSSLKKENKEKMSEERQGNILGVRFMEGSIS